MDHFLAIKINLLSLTILQYANLTPVIVNHREEFKLDKPSSLSRSLWRNGLVHWTSTSKVVGSSPTRDVAFSRTTFQGCSFLVGPLFYYNKLALQPGHHH